MRAIWWSIVARVRSLWRGLWRRDDVEAEMLEEFRHHIEARTEDLVRHGVPEQEASRQARLEFGHFESLREDARASRGLHVFDQVRFSWVDVKLGFRMLAKYPGLTVIGGLGLTVGVAMSVGFFSVLSAFVYPTLPLDEGARIVALENRNVQRNNEDRRVLHDFLAWRENLHTVRELGAFRTVQRNLVPRGGPPVPIHVAEMTAAGFTVARVPPLLGRTLVESDEQRDAPPVVIIGYDAWQSRFGGDLEIVGRTLRLDSAQFTVVGVMPRGFAFPENHQYWIPLKVDPDIGPLEGPSVYVFGRLAPGVDLPEAQAELSTVGAQAAAAEPHTHAQLRPMVMPYTQSLGDVQGASLWETATMQALMTLLLLVVAVNVAVLFYARTATRRGEIAVRSALGASRLRVAAQLFAEALALSSVAAALGLLLAQVGVRWGLEMLDLESEVGRPFWVHAGLQPRTIAFTVGLAVLVAVIVGVVPALQATGRGLEADLRKLSGGTSLRLGRTWTSLIVVQVALAVAVLPNLVVDAWSDIGSQWSVRPTYPAEEFLMATLSDGGEGVAPLGDRLNELVQRIDEEPGIAGASYMAALPEYRGRLVVEGVPGSAASSSESRIPSAGVGPGTLELLGRQVLEGRGLRREDVSVAPAGVVVNRAFVRRVLHGGTAVGRRLRYASERDSVGEAKQDRWHPIVGVIDNLYANRLQPDSVAASVYYPVPPEQVTTARLTVRLSQGGSRSAVEIRLRELALSVDPSLRLGKVITYADFDRQGRLEAELIALSLILVLISVILLSAGGIYALASFTVTLRRREIGIRSALGGGTGQVLRGVFTRAASQVTLGVVLGAVLAVAFDRLVGGTALAGRSALLVPLFAALLFAVATLATVGPARRGLRVHPMDTLRVE